MSVFWNKPSTDCPLCRKKSNKIADNLWKTTVKIFYLEVNVPKIIDERRISSFRNVTDSVILEFWETNLTFFGYSGLRFNDFLSILFEKVVKECYRVQKKNACNGDTNRSSPGDNFFTTHCNGDGWVADNAREWPGRPGRVIDQELNCTCQSRNYSRKRTELVFRKQAINSWKRLCGMNLIKMRILIWIHLTNKKFSRLWAIVFSL